MIHGYARSSTDGQSVDAQVRLRRAAGAEQVFEQGGRERAKARAAEL